MKRTLQKTLVTALTTLLLPAAHALNPQPGTYGGIIVGANYPENVPFNYVALDGTIKPAQLGYDIYGQIGGQIGYRWCDNFRFEGEAIYNNTPMAYLRLNDVTIHSPDTSTEWRLDGTTQSFVATFNAYYDLFGDYSSKLVPYIGGGIGWAYIVNKADLYYNDSLVTTGERLQELIDETGADITTPASPKRSGFVGQAIVGLSYHMDDYSFFAIDGRFMASERQEVLNQQVRQTSNTIEARYALWSVNLIFNGAFECL